jgi:tRNA(Phe) wybutosine-synthesizing methylase Tyw3
MKIKSKVKIKWYVKPEEHDYPAAESYLALVYPSTDAKKMAKLLKEQPIIHFKAKDIFRASKLSLLGVSNSHVEKNLKKIKKGQKMSPLLLVRDRHSKMVIVADGYHRMCAVYHYNEDIMIPCQIITDSL